MSSEFDSIIFEIQGIDDSDLSLRNKYLSLKHILERVCKDLSKKESSLQFPSLFSRIVFIAQKYNISKDLEWGLQNIRVKSSFLLKSEQNIVSSSQYDAAKNVIKYFIAEVTGSEYKEIFVSNCLDEHFEINIPLDKIRVQITEIDRDKQILICYSDSVLKELRVLYNVSKINDSFNPTIEQLWIGAQLNLIDIKIDDKSNYLIPKYIVLEPDYLIDASAIAECFQNYGKSHLHYFRRKFEPSANSKHILLGNLANFFLDELVYSEEPQSISFSDVFFKAFRQSPFEYTSCSDIKETKDFIDFMSRAESQFKNIQRVVIHDFPYNNIITSNCTLEPSFFCERFGFQGRLDLLQLSDNPDDNVKLKIIELKSGGLPYPKDDPGKISLNHETQTAVYRLIVQSVFNKTPREITAAILYSNADNSGENLRLSAPYQNLDKEIINIRNLIVATEHNIYAGDIKSVEDIFCQLFDLNNYSYTPYFFVNRLVGIKNVINSITELERNFLYRYIIFITRELYIQKIGGEDYFNSGTAALWNSEYIEREEAFDLISNLEIKTIDDSGNDMKISFTRLDKANFINFREGEICILYPHEDISDSVLTNQILKGAIAKIDNDEILVRFRYKQKNKQYLNKYKKWSIEHDRLDHTYNAMYKGLFSFLLADVEKRKIVLGVQQPRSYYIQEDENCNLNFSIGEIQERIIKKAICAQDYFLIVGPPGTGKTSVFAHRLIKTFYDNSNSNILVIAYTNRAVDELCEAINQAFGNKDNYIRIGSELSCGEQYRDQLLQNISEKVNSRKELNDIINNHRIYVGTLASIVGKQELFELKKFNIAIIDEASQILEPQIVGLLPKFDKFILIGDHKQLSTITLQDETKSKVDDPDTLMI